MPFAPLDVDWESIRTLAIAVGVREAARRVGISEESVMQRSCREGWLKSLPRDQELPPTIRPIRVSMVSTAPQAMGEYLRDLSAKTRLNHAKVADKIADKLSQSDADELLMQMPSVLMAGKHAALTAGNWTSGSGPTMRLDLLAGTLDVSLGSGSDASDDLDIPD
jgi:hypothetical protein